MDRSTMSSEGTGVDCNRILCGSASTRLREVCDHGVRRFCSDNGGELVTAGAPHARHGSKFCEELLPPAWPDAIHIVECGVQIAGGARLAMEGHGEAMRLIANSLDESQRRR